jgi:hypothetical protein
MGDIHDNIAEINSSNKTLAQNAPGLDIIMQQAESSV